MCISIESTYYTCLVLIYYLIVDLTVLMSKYGNMATFTIQIEAEKDVELIKKWESVLNYFDERIQPVPEHHQEKVAVLLEKVELAEYKKIAQEGTWKGLRNDGEELSRICKTLIPFIRRNYHHFINEVNLTIEHYPIEIGNGELSNVMYDYERRIIGNHLYDYGIFNLWKVNGKYFIDG